MSANAIDLILDGWQNTLTGLGTLADKIRASTWLSGTQPLAAADQYDEIYEQQWLARRVVQVFPEHALRKRPMIKDVEKQDDLWAKFNALNTTDLYPHGVLLQGLFQGRLHGGAVIVPGFRRGNPADPAPDPSVENGPLSEIVWLDVVRWTDLMLNETDRETDRNSPRFGLPRTYTIGGDHERRGYTFHASRAIFCEGAPRARYKRSNLTPWLSVLDPVIEELRRYDEAWQSVGHMLSEASIGVLKLAGLVGMIAGKDQDAVQNRMQLMTQGRSVARTVFLDADLKEDFSRTEVTFAGLYQILQQAALQVSGATEIPIALLLGQEPAGLSATGESDRAQFDDRVAVFQRTSVKPKQEKLMSWILGQPIALEYPPIRESTEAELAEIRSKNAASDKIYYDMSAVDAIDIAESRDADGTLGIKINIAAKRKALAEEAAREAEQADLMLTMQKQGVEGAPGEPEAPKPGAKPGAAPPKPGAKPGKAR